MAICKENQLNTMVSIYRYKQKPPYDTLFGWPEGLESLVRFAEKLWEEFVFEVLLSLSFPVSQAQGWELPKNMPREGWYHIESLQQVSWP